MHERFEAYPNLSKMLQQQLAVFPDHAPYIERRFQDAKGERLEFDEVVADKIIRIAGSELARVCEDYRWLCGEVLNEELHFRREGRYRLSSFKQALEEVYSNAPYMTRYMNGLLATQLWWENHTDVLRFCRDAFVAGNPRGFTHLEVGPGHGLFLHIAASSPNCSEAVGWDISEASIENTRAALHALDATNKVRLEKVDLFAAPKGRFQSIVFSEVLEHLEKPLDALRILHGLLAEGGRLFINAPVNSPAPDHIYLFSTPEDVVAMAEEAGFRIEKTFFAPATGNSLERCRKKNLNISAAVIAVK